MDLTVHCPMKVVKFNHYESVWPYSVFPWTLAFLVTAENVYDWNVILIYITASQVTSKSTIV